jgi:hypothetical protein
MNLYRRPAQYPGRRLWCAKATMMMASDVKR